MLVVSAAVMYDSSLRALGSAVVTYGASVHPLG